MKNSANSFSIPQNGNMMYKKDGRSFPGIRSGKTSENIKIQIKSIDMPALNMNAAETCGMRKYYNHPELRITSPMPFERNVEILKKLMFHIAEGWVFIEGLMIREVTEFEGKPVKVGFVWLGTGSKAVCNVVLYDMQDQYIGFPSPEQITWMNNQQKK